MGSDQELMDDMMSPNKFSYIGDEENPYGKTKKDEENDGKIISSRDQT